MHKLLHHLHAPVELVKGQDVLLREEAQSGTLAEVLGGRGGGAASEKAGGGVTVRTAVCQRGALTMLCFRILWTTGVNTSMTTMDRGRSRQCWRMTGSMDTRHVTGDTPVKCKHAHSHNANYSTPKMPAGWRVSAAIN